MTAWPLLTLAGAAVGSLMGPFGVGGASVATPVLSLLGVRPVLAVAAPLPAVLPGALMAASSYARSGDVRCRAVGWSLVGAVPATVLGGLLSAVVGGTALLVASGVVLVVVGIRVLLPLPASVRASGARRLCSGPLLVATAAGVGLLTGLLANGGGFLLMPLYLLVFGMEMRPAVGTSLLVVAVLAVPTLITHWALGHIDWTIAAGFAAGLLPASVVGTRVARGFATGASQQRAFGCFLVGFGLLFTVYRLVAV